MFRIFKTKHNFSQNEAYTKHKIQKCSSLNVRLSFSCQSIRFLVKEVSVSSAYFCYKFVVCLIFLHFFQKIWLLMNLYIPLQRGSDILKTTESSLRRCRTSADRNVGRCNFMVESITDESLESNCSINNEGIPSKGMSFSDFVVTFAISVGVDTYFELQH